MDKAQEELIGSLIGYGHLLLAFVNVYLAHQKGRDKMIWFFLTYCLSFVATIMLLITDKVDKQSSVEVGY